MLFKKIYYNRMRQRFNVIWSLNFSGKYLLGIFRVQWDLDLTVLDLTINFHLKVFP